MTPTTPEQQEMFCKNATGLLRAGMNAAKWLGRGTSTASKSIFRPRNLILGTMGGAMAAGDFSAGNTMGRLNGAADALNQFANNMSNQPFLNRLGYGIGMTVAPTWTMDNLVFPQIGRPGSGVPEQMLSNRLRWMRKSGAADFTQQLKNYFGSDGGQRALMGAGIGGGLGALGGYLTSEGDDALINALLGGAGGAGLGGVAGASMSGEEAPASSGEAGKPSLLARMANGLGDALGKGHDAAYDYIYSTLHGNSPKGWGDAASRSLGIAGKTLSMSKDAPAKTSVGDHMAAWSPAFGALTGTAHMLRAPTGTAPGRLLGRIGSGGAAGLLAALLASTVANHNQQQ